MLGACRVVQCSGTVCKTSVSGFAQPCPTRFLLRLLRLPVGTEGSQELSTSKVQKGGPSASGLSRQLFKVEGPTEEAREEEEEEEEEEREERKSLFVFMDTVEGPRAPAVKLTARHFSLTRLCHSE